MQAILQIYNKLRLIRHDVSLLSTWLWNSIESQQSLNSLSYLYKKFLEGPIMTRKESDDLFLTPLYRYAFDLANFMFPEFEVDSETGESFQCFNHIGFDAFFAIRENMYDFPFKKKQYDENLDIQSGLARLYIDPEAFWHALLMLHFLTQDKMYNAYTLGPTQKESVQAAINAIDTEDSTIIARKKNGRKVMIDDRSILAYIKRCLEESPFMHNEDDSRRVYFNTLSTCSDSEIMSYEAKALREFFEKESKPEVEKNGKKYRSPLLLISRLMYFTKMTRNDSFLVSSESLKKILRDYPNSGQRTVGRYTL